MTNYNLINITLKSKIASGAKIFGGSYVGKLFITLVFAISYDKNAFERSWGKTKQNRRIKQRSTIKSAILWLSRIGRTGLDI